MSARSQYFKIVQQDREEFGHGEVIYENDYIVVIDAVPLCPPMPKPWDKRPEGEDSIVGLCGHHSAVWSSFDQQNRTAKRRRPGKQERLAYTVGTHHQPDMRDGKVVVYRFNRWDETSWHSGGKAANRSTHYKRLKARQPHRSVNDLVIGFCFRGLMTTPWHHENWPEKPRKSRETIKMQQQGDLILRPSREQFQAFWGTHVMCQELFPNYKGTLLNEECWVLGHFDTGKVACPGIDAEAFIKAMRSGEIQSWEDAVEWMGARGIPEGGYPGRGYDTTPPAQKREPVEVSEPETFIDPAEVHREFPSMSEFQWLLVALANEGYPLGKYGRNRDGVDGKWGTKSEDALADFERENGLLTNGDPDRVSYDELTREYRRCYSVDPDFKGSAVAKRSERVREYDPGEQDDC